MAGRKPGLIALFDVDGTLTAPRKSFRARGGRSSVCLLKVVFFVVEPVVNDYDYVFSENGLVAYRSGELIDKQSLKTFLGEEKLKEIINFTLHYIADLDIPIKRGTFIEFRSGMLNVSPIGRNCSQEERDEFEKYDKVQNIRQKMVFPHGWDKTYCLRYLDDFPEIYFFGDKTYKAGRQERSINTSLYLKLVKEPLGICRLLLLHAPTVSALPFNLQGEEEIDTLGLRPRHKIFHPATNSCILRKHLEDPLKLASCEIGESWNYTPQKFLTALGTYFCLQAVGPGLPAKLGIVCTVSDSQWSIESESGRKHLSTKLEDGTVLCLDVDEDNTIITNPCTSSSTDAQGDSQWFEIITFTPKKD
ncbi:hypothetical protein HPP92_000764 [Vanilla planifolia]|uniref:Phosphomannomutase n=1 Tax=Vanilla planifolia TaxID=51239 RepID=A0A835VGA2_VANPL|nr:hypothetical protein HPP92_000764 [Vanilla planifolia]